MSLIKKLLTENTKLHEFSPIYKKIKNKKGFNKLIHANSFRELKTIGRSEFDYIAQGSSRMVFNIEDLCALKIAINGQGELQNETECDVGSKKWYDVVAEVFACTDNNRILLAEYGKKFSFKEFPTYTNISTEVFKEFILYLRMLYTFEGGDIHKIKGLLNVHNIDNTVELRKKIDNVLQKKRDYLFKEIEPEHYLWSLEQLFRDYILNPNDFTRDVQWAVVNRDGKDIPVLVDYGLTDDIWKNHYL